MLSSKLRTVGPRKSGTRIHWAQAGCSLLFLTLPLSVPPTTAVAATAAQGVPVVRSDFGVNTFAWDSQLAAPGAASALEQLGVGMQQFPNSINWDWQTNQAVGNPNDPTNPGGNPESLDAWGRLLESTDQTGLYIFNYDQAPGWTGGGTAADATQLAEYILTHHIPVSSIVIGDEEYGQWDFSNNLHKDKSALHYAELAAGIAQAIRAVLPDVKIGVSFEDGTSAHALEWDQDVLRLDGPYVNFLSVHSYPFRATDSASSILQRIPQVTAQLMQTADEQIAANLPASVASHLSVWVTEWNPEALPDQLSLTSTYGAAMVESLAAWRSSGAHRVFVWSFGGGRDASGSTGTFSLVGNGSLGTEAEDQLYPSGVSVSDFMKAIGSGGSLSSWYGSNGFVASVEGSAGAQSFFVNSTGQSQTYLYNGAASVTVSADSMAVVSGLVVSVSGMTSYSQPQVAGYSSEPAPLPSLTGVAQSVFPGEVVTLQGEGFGSVPGYIHLYQGNLDWGTSTAGGASWGSPGNWYAVNTLSWTPTSVTFVVPNDTSAPTGRFYKAPAPDQPTQISVVTASQTISNPAPLQVIPAPVPSLEPLSKTQVYPGQWVTISGTNLGSNSGNAYLHIVDNGISWGAPGNSYHISVATWSDGSITFQIPNGLAGSGISLPAGMAQLQLTDGQGTSSNELNLSVNPYGASITGISTAVLTSGESVTVTGSGFGSQVGYVQLTQQGTSWGAPGNSYGVRVTSWTSTKVTFLVPDGSNGSGPALAAGPAMLKVVGGSGVAAQPVQVLVSGATGGTAQ